MNWIEFLINILLPVIQVVATVFAAGTAIWAVCTWRKEHVGKRRIDLAEEVLAIVYEARDVLEAVRSLVGYPDEGATRQASPEENDKETAMLNQAFVQIERYNRRQDLFAQLRSLRYRFMAQHGGDSDKLFEELDEVRRSLRKPFYHLRLHIGALRRKREHMDKTEYDKELEELWHTWQEEQERLGFDGNGNDLVLKKVDMIVQGFEKICREVMGVQKSRG